MHIIFFICFLHKKSRESEKHLSVKQYFVEVLHMKVEDVTLPIHRVISLFIMASYTSEELVTARCKKLAVPLVVLATKDQTVRISIRWMLSLNCS